MSAYESKSADDRSQDAQQSKKQINDEELEELMRQEFARLNTASRTDDAQGTRRKLLLIYIHGFLGSEESFRAFPAHVHSLLAILLQETHVVHSKIYPRYRSKKSIRVARDEFSRWLSPHESPTTDVVLLGHSMGGLLSAEVVLLPASDKSGQALLHRILGTLSFDVPYLGMNAGVVRSGLASIFNPAKEPEDKYEVVGVIDHGRRGSVGYNHVLDSDERSFWETQDANFNAAFTNDVVLPARRFWQSVGHFVHKHGRDFASATHQLVSSHVEFMSAMSNSKELRERYTQIRMLEEDNAMLRKSVVRSQYAPARVRFANYYTVSTGRAKHRKQQAADDDGGDGGGVAAAAPATAAAAAPATAPQDPPMLGNAVTTDIDVAGVPAVEPALNKLAKSTSTDLTATQGESSDNITPFGEVKVLSDSSPALQSSRSQRSESISPHPPKQGTFCNLPPKDSLGQRDPTWVEMFMEDVDEVGAHCGMFFVDQRYEKFVGDVADRIEEWIKTDLALRAAQAEVALD